MNIEQLEGILETVETIRDMIEDSPLGLDELKKRLSDLETEVDGNLMILIYAKYQEEKG